MARRVDTYCATCEPVPLLPPEQLHDIFGSLRQAGYWLAIATNDQEISARRTAAKFGIADMFELIMGYDSVARPKPAADPILRFAEVSGVIAAELAMVGDNLHDAEMARGIGIDTSVVSLSIFALGAFLAALGGVVGGAFIGVYPGLDFEILPLSFAVVIIGGLGSLRGAVVGSLIVGLIDNFGKALFPEIAYFTLYAPMALILAVKPTGLFGREG